jgi:hypothetical protein
VAHDDDDAYHPHRGHVKRQDGGSVDMHRVHDPNRQIEKVP